MSSEFAARISRLAGIASCEQKPANENGHLAEPSYDDYDNAAEALLGTASDLLGVVKDHLVEDGSIVEDYESDGPLESRVRRLSGEVHGHSVYLDVICSIKGRSLSVFVRGERAGSSLSDSPPFAVDISHGNWLQGAQHWLEGELELAAKRLCK